MGPPEDVYSIDISIDFRAFYAKLLASPGGQQLWDSQDATSKKYVFADASTIFTSFYAAYVESCTTDLAIAERKEGIIADLKKEFPEQDTDNLVHAIEDRLRDHRSLFSTMREQFFMIDLYPENEERFPIAYEDVGGE